jgi:hypothetical protein
MVMAAILGGLTQRKVRGFGRREPPSVLNNPNLRRCCVSTSELSSSFARSANRASGYLA